MKWGYHPEAYIAETGLVSLPKPKKPSPDASRTSLKEATLQPQRSSLIAKNVNSNLPKIANETKFTAKEPIPLKKLNGKSDMPAETSLRLSTNKLAPLPSKESPVIRSKVSSTDDLLFDLKRDESSLSMFKTESPDGQQREQILSNWSFDDLKSMNTSDRKYSVSDLERILDGQKREVAEYPEQANSDAMASIAEMEEEVR